MKRKHFLAADVFGYSYCNYENHLGIGNVRYERHMPQRALFLERAEREGWNDTRVARELEIEPEEVANYRKAIRQALLVVDAPNPVEAFRRGVRISIENALGIRMLGESEIESLVAQICYRALDFGFLLNEEGSNILDYSGELRDMSGPPEPESP